MRRPAYLQSAAILFGLLWLGASPSKADLITFTFTGGGSGFLDGVPYSNPAFRITLTGDTADVIHYFDDPSAFALINLAATVDLGAPGAATFSEPFYIASLNDSGFTGIFLGAMSQYDDGNFYWSQDFPTPGAAYALDEPIGPITAPYIAGNFSFDSVSTSLGVLNIGQAGQATFQATVTAVPEPGSIALLGLGLISLGIVGERHLQVTRRYRRMEAISTMPPSS